MRLKDKVKNTDNKGRAYNYLVSKGLPPHIVAGIIGNFQKEASPNLNINAYNPDDLGKPSVGLAQWRGERKEKFEEFVRGDNSLEKQLDFVLWELQNTEKNAYNKLQNTQTPEEAALVFSQYYERPHKDYAHNDERVSYANQIYSSYADNNIYSTDQNGNPITVNPEYATSQEIQNSDFIKDQVYAQQGLTNYEVTKESAIFAEDNEGETPTEEEKVDPWKQKLQKEMDERSFIMDVMNSGSLDFQAPQYDRSSKVQRINQNYMQDGGEIPVSPNGLYEHPNTPVIVPTQNGKVTMKGISYPVLGRSLETGEEILMQPEQEYQFKNTKTVLEIPQR